jgi:uncharacterized lipoprotein YmbA
MPGAAQSAAAPPAPVRLARVRIPSEIDRRELVQRLDPTRLKLAEQHQWAAPLGELIGRVLDRNLETRLGAAVGTDSTAREPTQRSLTVDIRELLADASCRVTLRAEWTLSGPADQVRQGSESIEVAPAQACGIDAVPMTMSRALAELSDRLVAALAK